MTVPDTSSQPLFAPGLWTEGILSLILSVKLITQTCQISLLLFCTPSTYCLFMEQYVYNSMRYICVFFLLILLVCILCIEKVKCSSMYKLATSVEDDPKSLFSIATTPNCRTGRNSFPWIAPLYPWSLPYNAEC